MKNHRKEWPRIRERSKSGHRYYEVDLRRAHHTGQQWRTFSDLEEAKRFASETAAKVSRSGLQILETDTVAKEALSLINRWRGECALINCILEDVVQQGLAHFRSQKAKAESPFVSEMLTLWIDDKTNSKSKKLAHRSSKGIRSAANLMKGFLGDMRVAQVTRENIEQWMWSNDASQQTAKNRRAYAHQFFNWIIKKNYWVGTNPVSQIEPVEVKRGTPEFFTVEQCKRILEEAQKIRGLVPYIAIAMFAGVRPEECERMTWSNIRFRTGEIWLPRDITKTSAGRLFKMPDNLLKWLEEYRHQRSLIPNVNMQGAARRMRRALGFPWIADGLRHTFCSFHYATHQNIEQLRFIMGNSPSVIDTFYKGEISQNEVQAFWSLVPSPQQSAEATEPPTPPSASDPPK